MRAKMPCPLRLLGNLRTALPRPISYNYFLGLLDLVSVSPPRLKTLNSCVYTSLVSLSDLTTQRIRALRNALYKCSTYLLTYLLTTHDDHNQMTLCGF